MFKWINRRRFPLNCEVYVEYHAMSPLGRYKEKRTGNVVGYPSGFKLLLSIEGMLNYQKVDSGDCTRVEDATDSYPPL